MNGCKISLQPVNQPIPRATWIAFFVAPVWFAKPAEQVIYTLEAECKTKCRITLNRWNLGSKYKAASKLLFFLRNVVFIGRLFLPLLFLFQEKGKLE